MEQKKLFKGVYNWTFLAILIGAIVLVNIIATFVYFRYDATADKRFSLAENTVTYLQNENNFKNRLMIKIYLEGNLPAEVKRFRNAIEDKLKEFKQYTGKRLEYRFIDPSAGTKEDQNTLGKELFANGKGILPMSISYTKDGAESNMLLWPGAVIEYGGSTVNSIQFLPGTPEGKPNKIDQNPEFEEEIQNSINNLEYMLISAIRRSTQIEKKRIVFLQGHGELNNMQTQRVRTLISPYYRVEDLTLNDSVDALKGVDGLVIARPRSAFSEKDKYLIDQFLMNGGSLMCFIDKLELNKDSLALRGVTHTTRYNLELDKMLFDYGIKVNDNYVIDEHCAPKALPSSTTPVIPWFFDIAATKTKHPIARNLEPVMLRYVSEIQFVGNSKNAVSPILTSSTNSSVTGMAPLINLSFPLNYGPNPILVENPKLESNKVCLAGLVEGMFDSHYKNRIVESFVNNKESNYKERSTKEGKVLVVGNGTFIENKLDSMPGKDGKMMYRARKDFNELRYDETMVNMGVRPLIYGNQEFFQNMVDYMMGDNSVLDIRSKQIDIHAIDKEKIKTESGFYKMINMLLPSLFVVVMAFVFFFLRKRKFTKN